MSKIENNMLNLIKNIAQELEILGGLSYDTDEAKTSYDFFKQVHTLPKDAKSVF